MNEAQGIGTSGKHYRMILQSLAFYAQNTHDYKEAEDLFLQLAKAGKIKGHKKGEASAYHQLGTIMKQRQNFDAAEKMVSKIVGNCKKTWN